MSADGKDGRDKPVVLSRIYTRTGDGGTTALGDGSRVAKGDPRLAAYADVDEANCAIGTALALGQLDAGIAALLHTARTVVRRAERSAWAALRAHPDTVNPLTARYLNRLSDLLFILARRANARHGDVLWKPGGER